MNLPQEIQIFLWAEVRSVYSTLLTTDQNYKLVCMWSWIGLSGLQRPCDTFNKLTLQPNFKAVSVAQWIRHWLSTQESRVQFPVSILSFVNSELQSIATVNRLQVIHTKSRYINIIHLKSRYINVIYLKSRYINVINLSYLVASRWICLSFIRQVAHTSA